MLSLALLVASVEKLKQQEDKKAMKSTILRSRCTGKAICVELALHPISCQP
jgi:hypothetical protein